MAMNMTMMLSLIYIYMLLLMYKLNQRLLFPKSMVELAPQERVPKHCQVRQFQWFLGTNGILTVIFLITIL